MSNLKELKVASDATHENLTKLKEEKQLLLAEVDEKNENILSMNAKISELNRKI